MREKFFKKIIKTNYNNQLEEILGQKNFEEDVKNSLLSIFYKIENGYNDYKTVKRETFSKKDYIEKLMSIIENDCKNIKFISVNGKSKEKIDIEKKEIWCYPIDTNILYSIAKIRQRDIRINFLNDTIEKAVKSLLEVGSNINMVEPLRDFNGFSWNVITKDIEDLNYNLIYQNMIFLVGNDFIDKWANSNDLMVDYFEIFKMKLDNLYGKELKDKIIKLIIQISIGIKALKEVDYRENTIKKLNLLKEEKTLFENKEKYLSIQANGKKKAEKEIRRIDKIINDKKLLIEEYKKRNDNLSLDKKIFSIRIFKNILKEERSNLIKKIEEYNQKMIPKKFLERRKSINQQLNYMKIVENEGLEKNLHKKIIDLQKEIIKCMYVKLKKTKEKNEIINIIYQYRYYSLLNVSKSKTISNIRELEEDLDKLTLELVDRAVYEKIIITISKDKNLNKEIIRKLFLLKIIELENINVKITDSDEGCICTTFDEQIEDEEFKIEKLSKENAKIRFNKKVELFI